MAEVDDAASLGKREAEGKKSVNIVGVSSVINTIHESNRTALHPKKKPIIRPNRFNCGTSLRFANRVGNNGPLPDKTREEQNMP